MADPGRCADVRDWGALGTGDPTIDDEPAIEAAIAHVAAAGGGIVTFPPGH